MVVTIPLCAPHIIHPDSVMDGDGKSDAVHRDKASSAYSANNSGKWILISLKKYVKQKKLSFIKCDILSFSFCDMIK